MVTSGIKLGLTIADEIAGVHRSHLQLSYASNASDGDAGCPRGLRVRLTLKGGPNCPGFAQTHLTACNHFTMPDP